MKYSYCCSNPVKIRALKWRDSRVPLLDEVDCTILEPWWWNSWYLYLLTSSIWPIVKKCSQQLVLRYFETDPNRTPRQISHRSFHQRSHSYAVFSSSLLNLASVPSSTRLYHCDFLSLQPWMCTLFAGHLEQLAVHQKGYLKGCLAVWLYFHSRSEFCTRL